MKTKVEMFVKSMMEEISPLDRTFLIPRMVLTTFVHVLLLTMEEKMTLNAEKVSQINLAAKNVVS